MEEVLNLSSDELLDDNVETSIFKDICYGKYNKSVLRKRDLKISFPLLCVATDFIHMSRYNFVLFQLQTFIKMELL